MAVVASNLSEGRIVSRCELREKLGEAMVFFKRFQGCKERLLATGEVNERWVRALRVREVMTSRVGSTNHSRGRKKDTRRKTITKSFRNTSNINHSTDISFIFSSFPFFVWFAAVICEVEMSSHLNSSLVRVVSQRRTATPKPTTTTPAISEPSEADAPNPTSESNPMAPGAGGVRARRDADTSSLEDMPDEEESQSDEEELEQDEDAVDSSDEESDEDEEEGDEDEQELEEGGKRKKRFSLKWRPRRKRGPRSQSLYGLFQLSDRHYCESLHHRSKNRCETTCEGESDAQKKREITNDFNHISCMIISVFSP